MTLKFSVSEVLSIIIIRKILTRQVQQVLDSVADYCEISKASSQCFELQCFATKKLALPIQAILVFAIDFSITILSCTLRFLNENFMTVLRSFDNQIILYWDAFDNPSWVSGTRAEVWSLVIWRNQSEHVSCNAQVELFVGFFDKQVRKGTATYAVIVVCSLLCVLTIRLVHR